MVPWVGPSLQHRLATCRDPVRRGPTGRCYPSVASVPRADGGDGGHTAAPDSAVAVIPGAPAAAAAVRAIVAFVTSDPDRDPTAATSPATAPRCRAPSASSCTPTCPGCSTTARGQSARSGSTRRGPSATSRRRRARRAWRPRGTATCSRSASRPCWPPSSTTRTAVDQCAHVASALAAARRELGLGPGRTGAPRALRVRAAPRASAALESRWRHGGSPVLRPLRDAGVVELLGGPATHPFLPLLLPEMVRRSPCDAGLDDTPVAAGCAPDGHLVARSAATAPGWSTLRRPGRACGASSSTSRRSSTAAATPAPRRTVDGTRRRRRSPRDLEVTYRVWSPRSGYPGRGGYRDFHRLRPRPPAPTCARHRTGRRPRSAKAPYDPDAAAAQLTRRRRRLRRRGLRPAAPAAPRARPPRDWSSRPTTPSCSGTGGTRAPRSSSAVPCGRCPRPACR